MIPTWVEDKILQLLSQLKSDYKKIAPYGSWVVIDATNEHRELASLLVEHKYSSAPEKDGTIKFNIKKSPY